MYGRPSVSACLSVCLCDINPAWHPCLLLTCRQCVHVHTKLYTHEERRGGNLDTGSDTGMERVSLFLSRRLTFLPLDAVRAADGMDG
mmetsp:Transcript_20249/g.49192  ORF Transcript_20249/g.49192 Transcript_20249/m.49192 type:complete len:87 (+) Transcript_20249:3-263(+)